MKLGAILAAFLVIQLSFCAGTLHYKEHKGLQIDGGKHTVMILGWDHDDNGTIDASEPQCTIDQKLWDFLWTFDDKWEITMQTFPGPITKAKKEISDKGTFTEKSDHDWCKIEINDNQVHIIDAKRRLI